MIESVNLTQLRAYALQHQDRRQDLLEPYITGMIGDWSQIAVEHYLAPGYGRLLAQGPAGQKLTREAREIAFAHLVEIDAPRCHPRLLHWHLQKLTLWTAGDYHASTLLRKLQRAAFSFGCLHAG